MDIFFLYPAPGEPAFIAVRIFAEFPEALCKLKLQVCRRIRVTALIGQLQGKISHVMSPKIKTEILASPHREMRELLQR